LAPGSQPGHSTLRQPSRCAALARFPTCRSASGREALEPVGQPVGVGLFLREHVFHRREVGSFQTKYRSISPQVSMARHSEARFSPSIPCSEPPMKSSECDRLTRLLGSNVSPEPILQDPVRMREPRRPSVSSRRPDSWRDGHFTISHVSVPSGSLRLPYLQNTGPLISISTLAGLDGGAPRDANAA
jgi:hypothetical protein